MFDPRLLVGYDSSDDACVYSVSDDVAVIETVDFFTPIVDDPYLFGQIAAANALSDVYAMGGGPAASSPADTPFRTTSRNTVCASPASFTRSTSSRTSARSRATCSC